MFVRARPFFVLQSMAKRNPCADPQPGDVLSQRARERWNTRIVTERTLERVTFWWNGNYHETTLEHWKLWAGGSFRERVEIIWQAPEP